MNQYPSEASATETGICWKIYEKRVGKWLNWKNISSFERDGIHLDSNIGMLLW